MTDSNDKPPPLTVTIDRLGEHTVDELLATFTREQLQDYMRRRETQLGAAQRGLLTKFCQEARARGLTDRLNKQLIPVTVPVTALIKISPSPQWKNIGRGQKSSIVLRADVKCLPHPEHGSIESQIEQTVAEQTNAADLAYKQVWGELFALATTVGLKLEEICFPFEDFIHRLNYMGSTDG